MRETLTSEKEKQLWDVNYNVNTDMTYVTDLEQYNKLDHWPHIPGKFGDCEDYARAKELQLRKLGWDKNCIGRATCWPKWTDGYHCVLLVNTDKGTYVLDWEMEPMPWFDAKVKKWGLVPDYILSNINERG